MHIIKDLTAHLHPRATLAMHETKQISGEPAANGVKRNLSNEATSSPPLVNMSEVDKSYYFPSESKILILSKDYYIYENGVDVWAEEQ